MKDDKVYCVDFGLYRLDISNNRLLKNDVPVYLTQRSFEVLRYLAENSGRILKKDELLDSIWGEEFAEETTLTQHIYMLRKVLKDGDKDGKYIETIPKVGYRFIAEVSDSSYEKPQIRPVEKNFSHKEINQSNIKIIHQKTPPPVRETSGLLPQIVSRKSERKSGFGKFFSVRNVSLAGFTVFICFVFGLLFFDLNSRFNKIDSARINSIVVLPFEQIGGKKDEKIGLGTADVLISNLGKFENLTVLPTNAIAGYTDENAADLSEIGKKLNVDAVLTGTIEQHGEIFTISVQLYNTRDKTILWSENFNEDYSNIFALQDKVSEQISNKLSIIIKNKKYPPTFVEHAGISDSRQSYLVGVYYLIDTVF